MSLITIFAVVVPTLMIAAGGFVLASEAGYSFDLRRGRKDRRKGRNGGRREEDSVVA